MKHTRALNVLAEVARSGSIRRAAEHLNIAPSAVTRQIQDMEHELGTPAVRTTAIRNEAECGRRTARAAHPRPDTFFDINPGYRAPNDNCFNEVDYIGGATFKFGQAWTVSAQIYSSTVRRTPFLSSATPR